MSEHALKCENSAIFKQNYTMKMFIAFKMAYSCCFGCRGNLDFPEFLQRKFFNINYRMWSVLLSTLNIFKTLFTFEYGPLQPIFIFVIFNNNLTAKILDFSKIRTQINTSEGMIADHLTTNTTSTAHKTQ